MRMLRDVRKVTPSCRIGISSDSTSTAGTGIQESPLVARLYRDHLDRESFSFKVSRSKTRPAGRAFTESTKHDATATRRAVSNERITEAAMLRGIRDAAWTGSYVIDGRRRLDSDTSTTRYPGQISLASPSGSETFTEPGELVPDPSSVEEPRLWSLL